MEPVSSEEEFPINNQLGLPNIDDQETEWPFPEENDRAREPPTDETTSTPCRTTEIQTTDIQNAKESDRPPTMSSDTNMIMLCIKQLQESIDTKLQENNAKLQESISENRENNEQTRQLITQIEQKIDRQIERTSQELNTKIQEQTTRIDNFIEKIQQTKTEIHQAQKTHETR